MRYFEDPANRVRVIEYYRLGMSSQDLCYLMRGDTVTSVQMLRTEHQLDPAFATECGRAMEDVFRPVLMGAITLAKMADAEGEFEGAHKALALVMKHYGRHLDRKIDVELANRTLQTVGDNSKPRGSLVLGPDGVKALIAGVKDIAMQPDVIDVEEAEEAELTG